MEGALGGDVEPAEALVVGDAQAGEGLVVVQVEPVDAHVQVAAKQEADGGRGQHPVVGQHAAVVGCRLQARAKLSRPVCLTMTPAAGLRCCLNSWQPHWPPGPCTDSSEPCWGQPQNVTVLLVQRAGGAAKGSHAYTLQQMRMAGCCQGLEHMPSYSGDSLSDAGSLAPNFAVTAKGRATSCSAECPELVPGGKAEAPHTVSGRLLEGIQAVTCSLVSEVTPWHRALRDTAMASGTSNIAKAACRMPGYRPPVHLEQVPRKSWGSGKASASKRWYHLNRELYPSPPRDSYLCQGGSVAALAP